METVILGHFGAIMWVSGSLLVYWFIDVVVDMLLAFINLHS